MRSKSLCIALAAWAVLAGARENASAEDPPQTTQPIQWLALPQLPNELGVAGPFVGVHGDCLVVAGGANFPTPVWQTQKLWTDEIWVLKSDETQTQWLRGGNLVRPLAYGASASVSKGIICIGGNDQLRLYDEVFMLSWNDTAKQIDRTDLPSLPKRWAYGQATAIGEVVYVACGQNDAQLSSASSNLWALDLGTKEPEALQWQELPPLPAQPRAFNITTHQSNGEAECVYVLGGRFQDGNDTKFLNDVWEFHPQKRSWRRRADMPYPVAAGTGIGFGHSEIWVLGGDDGSLFTKTDELKDQHPGFRKEAQRYDSLSDKWSSLGTTPINQVTTTPVLWNSRVVIASGEIRPRVRTPAVWSVGKR